MRLKGVLHYTASAFVVSVAFMMLSAGAAWGGMALQGKLYQAHGFGQTKNIYIHLGASVTEQSDSNVYETAPGLELDDNIHIFSPAVLIGVQTVRTSVDASYSADIHKYSEYSNEDFTAHTATANYSFTASSGFRLKASDQYMQTKGTRPSATAVRDTYYTNNFDAEMAYVFPAKRLTLRVFASSFQLQYKLAANQVRNREDDAVGVGLKYRFLPKTSFTLEYSYGTTDYYDSLSELTDGDSSYQEALIGLLWDPTAKLAGELKAGYKRKEYDNYQDVNGDLLVEDLPVAQVNLTYTASPTSKLFITGRYSLEETTYAGDIIGLDVYDAASNYEAAFGSLGVELVFADSMTLTLSGVYEFDAYNRATGANIAREDTIVAYDASLRYNISKWLAATVSANSRSLDSNADTNDRDKTLYSFTFAAYM